MKEMKQFSNTFKRMAGAMERETITKNRVSPKNDRSKNKLMSLAALLTLVLTLGLFSGCDDSKHPSKLVGKWERTGGTGYDDNGRARFFIGHDRIELLKDGKVLYQDYGWHGNFDRQMRHIFDWGDVKTGTWEVSDSHLFIRSNEDDTYDYEISGSELTLRQFKYGKDHNATYRKTSKYNDELNYSEAILKN
jgi:hypothetical protein